MTWNASFSKQEGKGQKSIVNLSTQVTSVRFFPGGRMSHLLSRRWKWTQYSCAYMTIAKKLWKLSWTKYTERWAGQSNYQNLSFFFIPQKFNENENITFHLTFSIQMDLLPSRLGFGAGVVQSQVWRGDKLFLVRFPSQPLPLLSLLTNWLLLLCRNIRTLKIVSCHSDMKYMLHIVGWFLLNRY